MKLLFDQNLSRFPELIPSPVPVLDMADNLIVIVRINPHDKNSTSSYSSDSENLAPTLVNST